MEKIKLYIATKMMGLTREQIQEKLDHIAHACGFDNYEIINFVPADQAEGKKPVELLGMSIQNLAHADVVIIEKYEEMRGVSCEEYICNKYKIPYQKVFLNN